MEISCITNPKLNLFVKNESVQYKAALAIIGALQDTSLEKIYQELGLESLKSRRWYSRLSCRKEEGGKRKHLII